MEPSIFDLTQPDHCSLGHGYAGAGGESVDDGKMNTRDFDLYYKKDEAGEWSSLRKFVAMKPMCRQYTRPSNQGSRLASPCITADNGTPWQAIPDLTGMYESLDTETVNIPMKHAAAVR